MFIGDVGGSAFEEINLGQTGANYGWPNAGARAPTGFHRADPHLSARRRRTVTGGYVYRGESDGLNGQYFFADFVHSKVFTLRFDGAGWAATDRTGQIAPNVGTIDSPASFGEDGAAISTWSTSGAANEVLRGLRDLRVDVHGSVVIEPVDMAFPGRASEGATRRLGALAGTPVWEQVEARIRSGGRYAPSFYLYLVVAGLIGSVGIMTNSQILIVGAMVVGPEYGAIVAVALGLDRGTGAWSAPVCPLSGRAFC